MLSSQERDEIAPLARQLTVIYGALMATLPMYGFLAVTIGSKSTGKISNPGFMIALLAAVSAVELGLAFILPSRIASPRRLGTAPSASAAFRIWLSSAVVRAALFEAVAISGLLLTFMGCGLEPFLVASGISLILFILFWPRTNAFEGRLVEGRRLAKGV